MKTICKAGIIAVAALILNVKTSTAQESNSGEGIRMQFVKNKVPGLKYGPEKKSSEIKKSDKPKNYTKGNFKSTLDDGKSQPGTTAARRSVQKNINNNARNAQKPLPSDKPAEKIEQVKPEPPKPPSQEVQKKKLNKEI